MREHNIPITNHLQTLIRRTDAGDSKVTYYEFGREIFKNYNDSQDAPHYARGSESELTYKLIKRAQSPDVKRNTRFGMLKPKDNIMTQGRVID